MTARKPNALYRNLTRRGFTPTHVAEVGVHQLITSNVYDYILDDVRCTLVEPNPDSVMGIEKALGETPNVTLHPYAINEVNGPVRLVCRGPSTFLHDVGNSPAAVNDRYVVDDKDVCVVEGRTFDRIDDGTIDLLSIDVEGSEWYVISRMTSRPRVISVETHGSLYENPHLGKILEWMRRNGYVLIYRNTSDSTFARDGALKRTVLDRIGHAANAVYLRYKKAAKSLKHRVSAPVSIQ